MMRFSKYVEDSLSINQKCPCPCVCVCLCIFSTVNVRQHLQTRSAMCKTKSCTHATSVITCYYVLLATSWMIVVQMIVV